MIARVRPSLNGARESLKTWDEANVVWPRFEVRNQKLAMLKQMYTLNFFKIFNYLANAESSSYGGNENRLPKANGSKSGSGRL